MFFVNPVVRKLLFSEDLLDNMKKQLEIMRQRVPKGSRMPRSDQNGICLKQISCDVADCLTAIPKCDGVEERIHFYLTFAPAIAGAASGFFANGLLYPLETLKTRVQSSSGLMKSGGYRGLYRDYRPMICPFEYIAHVRTLRKYRTYGALAFCICTIPMNGFFLGCYETIKMLLAPYLGKDSLSASMLSATASRVIVLFFRVPVEVVKQRRQMLVYVGDNNSIKAIVKEAYQQEGIRGLYRGYTATFIRDVPYSLTELPLWELLKMSIRNRTMSNEVTTFQSAYCGLIAGGVASYLTAPFDLIKTRVVLAHPQRIPIKYVIRDEFKKGGVRGLFQGFHLRMIIIMMNRFVFFGIYDTTRLVYENILRKYMRENDKCTKP